MTTECLFIKNPWQDIKLINKYGIPITNILSILLSPILKTPKPSGISLNCLDSQAS